MSILLQHVFDEIPVIDMDLKQDEVVKQIRYACQHIGFFYVSNHGVNREIMKNVHKASRKFFDLPVEEKMRIARSKFNSKNSNKYRGYFPYVAGADSLKEGLDVGVNNEKFGDMEGNVWVADDICPNLQDDVMTYFSEVHGLGNRLLKLMGLALNESEDYFEEMFRDSVSTLRLLNYPPKEVVEGSGRPMICSEHTDSGLLTLLWQDSTGGLQVLNQEGRYVDAPFIEGTFVINIGDFLQHYSGGKFKATIHRVMGSSKERMSIPFFFEPSNDAPMNGYVFPRSKTDEAKDYKYGEFIKEKIKQFIEFN